MKIRHSLSWMAMLALAAPAAALAGPEDFAPGMPSYVTQSVIGGNALANVQGRAAVNIVAGDSNLQANTAALAIGLSEAQVSALAINVQRTDARQATYPGHAFATIGDHAFSGATGMVSINQASGVGNAQSNTAAFGLGFEAEVVAESVLAATASRTAPAVAGAGDGRLRGVSIADSAFEGARGLVQVNQSAGSGNTTANNFALRVQAGASKP